jgi:glycosyltransferase involved in cell wall biosynthesis
MKLALVHDWLNQRGGAEDVLEVLVEQFPASPVYTSIYAPDLMPPAYQSWDIRTLWLNRAPAIHRRHQPYLPLYPLAWGSLNLSDYDIIVSNKSGFCHGVRHGEQTLHICYCLTPTRYVWSLDAYLEREGLGMAARLALRPLAALLRRWDFNAAQRVDRFIAISTEIRQRIQQFYRREAPIIFPPVMTERFQPANRIDDYFLVVSRLVPYKRIDLAVQAATRLGVRLLVGGKGRDLDRLRAMAGPTVEFLGYVPDDDLPELMARCKAFIFPGLEDFGITPVQAQAAGRPVIAFAGGGALDTVIPGRTGELFSEMTVESLMAVMTHFDDRRYNTTLLRAHAQQFDAAVFKRALTDFIDAAWDDFRAGQTRPRRQPANGRTNAPPGDQVD